jgi:phosphotransferase system  glucose/maltose/N-acetylglucosamine-specific IIC component
MFVASSVSFSRFLSNHSFSSFQLSVPVFFLLYLISSFYFLLVYFLVYVVISTETITSPNSGSSLSPPLRTNFLLLYLRLLST